MEPKTAWRCLDDSLLLIQKIQTEIIPGMKSHEKNNQALRESMFEEKIYSSKYFIPDSPQEPNVLEFPDLQPFCIPIEDTSGISNTYSFESWPEPKNGQITLILNTEIKLYHLPLNYDIQAINRSHQSRPFQWHVSPPNVDTRLVHGNNQNKPFQPRRSPQNYESQMINGNSQVPPYYTHPWDARVYVTTSGQYQIQHKSSAPEEQSARGNSSEESTSTFYRAKIRNEHRKNCSPKYTPYRVNTK